MATPLTRDDIGVLEEFMLFLAKLVGEEHGELKCKCLMTIVEITAEAESNLDLRCKAFKTKSPCAKAIVSQLLTVIQKSKDPKLLVLAIRSIGSLARIFCERKNHHVIGVLVSQLSNDNQEVATEAVVALTKFACEDNYLCKAHSKRMIKHNAVQPLVKLLTYGERTQQQQQQQQQQLHGLELMCYLALNADYSKAMEEARVLTVVQQYSGQSMQVVSQHPGLKELVAKALQNLMLYYKH
ncbi:hypothetical protein PTKIN_Ptkin10aG0188500 [Pterospermum kingtungense]